MRSIPCQEYLRAKFILDEETGWLYWLHDSLHTDNWNVKYAGTAAGIIKKDHIHINLDGVSYLAHRLIWVYLYGYEPGEIDHKDGNGFLNTPENLREVTHSQNLANANFGDMRGVEKHGRKYRVRIWVKNERIGLGSFDTLEEAKEASRLGHIKYFGEFAFASREA